MNLKQIKKKKEENIEVLKAESDVQALWQGGLLASDIYQVFSESNHVSEGRADLVVIPINRDLTEHIKVVELKHGSDHKEAEKLPEIARGQVQGYVTNLKSFTDDREVELIALIYDASGQGDNLFSYEKLPLKKILHTSGSERVENSQEEYAESSQERMDVDEEKSPPYEKDVEMPLVDEAVPPFGPANTEGLKTPPYKNPSSDYVGDVESNAGSPEKRRTGVSFLGGILGGIFSALGGLAGGFRRDRRCYYKECS